MYGVAELGGTVITSVTVWAGSERVTVDGASVTVAVTVNISVTTA